MKQSKQRILNLEPMMRFHEISCLQIHLLIRDTNEKKKIYTKRCIIGTPVQIRLKANHTNTRRNSKNPIKKEFNTVSNDAIDKQRSLSQWAIRLSTKKLCFCPELLIVFLALNCIFIEFTHIK